MDESAQHRVEALARRTRELEIEVEGQSRLELLMAELLQLTSELAQARTREEIGSLTIENACRTVGAIAAAMWTRTPDGGELELLAASRGTHPAALTAYRRIPLAHSDAPVAVVARTGEPVFLRSRADYAARFPASLARGQGMLPDTHVAFAVVPLVAGDTCLGAVYFAYDHERAFDDSGRSFKQVVGRHAALALARIQLLEREREQRAVAERSALAERQARSDVELLYELTASMNRLDRIESIYELALHSVLRLSQADRAAILLFDGDEVMRFRAHTGLSEAYRRAVEGHTPWRRDDAFAAPITIADTETDSQWADYRPVFRAEGIRALAFIPVVHQREVIGKFMLYRNEPRPFAARELQLAATVAVHVAQGIERKRQERELARAYREEREAHHLAEEAARAREEILSVVSHDLRNPLGTILMGATTLLNIDAADRAPRVRATAERIHRQAERMARLIEDLVDFAGIQAGRLTLERATHAPAAILSTTTEIFGPIASERGLRLDTEVIAGMPAVDCDSDRAVQVLSNLVSNALKVTPRGGTIAIGATTHDAEVVFYVRDTGPGIAPEDLPNLFERYWRGKQPTYKGAGLGLSIARGIVSAHGGRIWAESQLGSGSTFYFSLTSKN